MSSPWHTVHVRVNDAATGRPTPVRIRFANVSGEYFPPLGRLAEFATSSNQDVGGNLLLGTKAYAYIDGGCEVRLPAGPLVIDVYKGPEYTPLHLETTLGPGQMSLRLQIARWSNLLEERWISGDSRAHCLAPHAALLEAAAEDLAVVNLLATECGLPGPSTKNYQTIPNLLAFSGQRAALEISGHRVVVNTLNTHPILGSLGLLHCHRVVFPLSFGGLNGLDDWSLAEWCDQCHRKKGLVVWTRPQEEKGVNRWGEPLADLILGKVDAFEIDSFADSPLAMLSDWYALLNSGFPLPLCGASGKDSNGTCLGSMRMYAQLSWDEEFTYSHWIEAVRAGRTFVTNGPMLRFTGAGLGPGATIDLAPSGQKVRVRAEAHSNIPFDRLEVIANNAVVASAAASGSPSHAGVETELEIEAGTWLAARCWGEQQVLPFSANQRVFAHTSPVYVRVKGQSPKADPGALAVLVGQLDGMIGWVVRDGRFANDKQRDHLLRIFTSAKEKVLQRQQGCL